MAEDPTYEPATRGRDESRLQPPAGQATGEFLAGQPGAVRQGAAAGREHGEMAGRSAVARQGATAGSEPGEAAGQPAAEGEPAIGPAGAAPQWRDFYRAIRDAVIGMRSDRDEA